MPGLQLTDLGLLFAAIGVCLVLVPSTSALPVPTSANASACATPGQTAHAQEIANHLSLDGFGEIRCSCQCVSTSNSSLRILVMRKLEGQSKPSLLINRTASADQSFQLSLSPPEQSGNGPGLLLQIKRYNSIWVTVLPAVFPNLASAEPAICRWLPQFEFLFVDNGGQIVNKMLFTTCSLPTTAQAVTTSTNATVTNETKGSSSTAISSTAEATFQSIPAITSSKTATSPKSTAGSKDDSTVTDWGIILGVVVAILVILVALFVFASWIWREYKTNQSPFKDRWCWPFCSKLPHPEKETSRREDSFESTHEDTHEDKRSVAGEDASADTEEETGNGMGEELCRDIGDLGEINSVLKLVTSNSSAVPEVNNDNSPGLRSPVPSVDTNRTSSPGPISRDHAPHLAIFHSTSQHENNTAMTAPQATGYTDSNGHGEDIAISHPWQETDSAGEKAYPLPSGPALPNPRSNPELFPSVNAISVGVSGSSSSIGSLSHAHAQVNDILATVRPKFPDDNFNSSHYQETSC